MTSKLALFVAAICCSVSAQAEIAEFIFNDTQNVKKTVKPEKIWLNPIVGFDVAVISGLDRYVTLSLLNSTGASVWSVKSSLVTVDDRLTSSSGFDYYGKTISIPAMGEDHYTLREVISDLQGNTVATRDYSISIDRTPPATGGISYMRNGWQFGDETVFTSLPPGMQYASIQALTFNGLSDPLSGLDRAEYFTVDPSGTLRKQKTEINLLDGSVTVQIDNAASATVAPVAQGEYKIGVYVYDKAGNRGELSRKSTIDRVRPWEQIQVLNSSTGQWENYTSGITAYSNPIQVRVLRRKADFTAINGTRLGWADGNYQSSDGTYNIYTFNYIYPNSGDTYHEFQTQSGGVRRVHHNNLVFTPAPSLEKAPTVLSKEMYRSDTGAWVGSATDKTLKITAFRVTAEPRGFVQRISSNNNNNWYCTIPVGQTSCQFAVDFTFDKDKGLSFLHLISGKDGNNIYNNLAGNMTVIWDTNPPVISSATLKRPEKVITMVAVDNDRSNTWMLGVWDTRLFGAILKNQQGATVDLPASSWNESDYRTKNATISYAALPDGRYNIESVYATDTLGNKATRTLNETLLIDSVAPVINYSYQGTEAEGKLIKGLENLSIKLTDSSDDARIESISLRGGPNSESVTLTSTPTGKDTYVLEYPRIFPNTGSDDSSYELTVNAIDGSGNRSSKRLTFFYEPANLIVLDRLKTLGTATALKLSDGTPLAYLKTSLLRRQDGSVITGVLNGTITVRKDADFPVTVSGVTVAPGQTKVISLDMGLGEERIYPITPGASGVTGTASFAVEFPQV